MKNLGIYVHIPFCAKKCSYCDFISFANKKEYIEEYINALIKEIENNQFNNKFKNGVYRVDTIYIGGGTPSFIDAKYIKKILNVIKNNFTIKNDVEITIEVNPGTVDEKKLKMYKEVGINRISIGLQSTNDKILNQIGRIHCYEQFLENYNLARKNGFKNINVDLMLALPNQKIKDLKESIDTVIKLKPEHISVYSLILEEETPLNKLYEENKIQLPSDEEERKMYWMVKEKLEENGYIHYEISNFAKEGYESKHNLNCWNQNEYLGFGLAAHSYINSKRYCNISNLEKYLENINKDKIKENIKICEIQNEEDKKNEYMMLALRKIQGVDINAFKNKFVDNPIFIYRNKLAKLTKEGLVEVDFNTIKLTSKGLDLANIVWEEFV